MRLRLAFCRRAICQRKTNVVKMHQRFLEPVVSSCIALRYLLSILKALHQRELMTVLILVLIQFLKASNNEEEKMH